MALKVLTKTLHYWVLKRWWNVEENVDEVFFLNLSNLFKVTQLIRVQSQIQVYLDPEVMLHSTTCLAS